MPAPLPIPLINNSDAMKRIIALFIGAAFIVAFTFEPATDKITVTGKLIDTKCYGMNHMNHDNEHMVPMEGGKMGKMPNCATACAGMGIPVGIVEGDYQKGKTYVLITPAGALAEHMARQARVTGELAYKGGIIPDKIEVKNDDGDWEEVSVATMM